MGIGEEAFFRGFLQSAFAELVGPYWGWAIASGIFGLVHAPNALQFEDPQAQIRYLTIALPFITGLGAYMGWVYMHNQYSLSESVALHFWYDVLITGVSFALDPKNQPFVVNISLPF